ncbi:MAG: hypothetical protein ABR915_03480 [Thermoguttaceae bacterium]
MNRIVGIALSLAVMAASTTVLAHRWSACSDRCALAVGATPAACPSAAAKVPTLAPPQNRPAPAVAMFSQVQPRGQVVYVTVEVEAASSGGQH